MLSGETHAKQKKTPVKKVAVRKTAARKTAGKKGSKPARKPGDFYPPIKPYNKGFLRVSSVHEIYYEESGNPNGKPVVFLHGGPGGGTDAKMRQFFNPKKYRIVLFDQRGSGKSRPAANSWTTPPGTCVRHRNRFVNTWA